MYNTTISNSYKDDKSGEWKTTTSFGSADLLVVGEVAPHPKRTPLKSATRKNMRPG
jgi:hypothetical protein